MHDRMYGTPSRGKADWRVIRDLWPYLRQHPQRMTLALICLILAKVCFVAVPILLKHIVDSLDRSLQPDPVVAMVVVPLALLFAYGALRFGSVLFNELRDAVFGRVAERTLSQVGLSVFRHLHKLDLEFHLSRRTGGLSRDIERGTNGVSFMLRAVVFSVVPIFVEVGLVLGILLLNFDAMYALVVLVAVALYVAFSVVVTEWRTGFVRLANVKDSEANTRAIDSLINYETVKYFGNENFEAERYGQHLLARENAKVKNHLSLAALNSGQALIIAGSITVLMIMAANQVADQTLTLGDLAMINAFMIQVFIPLNVLGFVYREIKRSLADVEAMFALTKITPAIQDKAGAITLPDSADGVVFEHVSFAYHNNRPILDNISFQVKPGEKVAIVGPSGAGKSTIARLLYRFYDVSAGAIKIGGIDIRELTQDSLRQAIGMVPQDTVLFNDTLRDNLLYGNPQASEHQLAQAIERACLREFLAKLPDGDQTLVGERGLKVSGGEKQRIAIARTLLKNPRIMVFDEATSALDTASEKAIMAALKQVAAHHTTLVIAHRLSTIVDADRILVLDNGRVVEQGSHQQLLQRPDGLYAHLWRMQQQQENLP